MTETSVPKLTSLYIYASGACNLNCTHCWINPDYQEVGTKTSLHLDIELVKKAVKQGKPLGLSSVKLTGGEPLMNPAIKEIVNYISSQKLGIVIETNGTLVNKEMAKFLRDTEYFRFISVSLDGADARTHEELRRVKGCFNMAVQGIKNLVEVGIRPQVICTLHKNNISQIKDIVNLTEELKCSSIKFNHVQQVGRGMDFDDENSLSVPEIIAIDKMIENDLSNNMKISIHPDIPMAFRKPARFLRSAPGRCNVLNIMGLLSDGGLALCGIGTSVDELLYGNIKTDCLREIWVKSPKLSKLRETVPERLTGICSNCIHRFLCKGTCVAANFNRTGRLDSSYHFCETAEKLGLFPESRLTIPSHEKGMA